MGLAVHQPPHQLLRPAGLLPSAIEMIFLLLVLAISLDQGTAPIQLCLVSVSDPGSRVLGIGKANKVRDSAQQLLPCLNRISNEKDFLALLDAVQKWRHYIRGAPFFIRTHHESRQYLL